MSAHRDLRFKPVGALRSVAATLLVAHLNGGIASTLEGIPSIDLRLPCGSVASTVKIFPSDSGIEPTDWIVSTSDGRRERFALGELPELQISHRVMWIRHRRVTNLQTALCEHPDALEHDGLAACRLLRTEVLLTEEPLEAGCRSPLHEAPGLIFRGETSEIGAEILRHCVDGETVEVMPKPEEPEPDFRLHRGTLDLDP
jgi:hypothetical protein